MGQIWYRDDQTQFGGRKLHLPWCATPSSAEKPICVGSQTQLLAVTSPALLPPWTAIPSTTRGMTPVLTCIAYGEHPLHQLLEIGSCIRVPNGAERSIALALRESCLGRNEASSSRPCWTSAVITAAQPY